MATKKTRTPKSTPAPAAPGAAPEGAADRGRGEARAEPVSLKVRAIERGYYDHRLREPGDVFTIESPTLFSSKWMAYVGIDTAEKLTGAQEALNRETHRIALEKAGRVAETSADNPIGAD